MATSETDQFVTAIKKSSQFLCDGSCSPVRNPLQWIKLGRFVQACSACAVLSGTLPFPLYCFFPKTELSDLPSLPSYTSPCSFTLQKLFQSDRVSLLANSVKSNYQFFQEFLTRLVDSLLIFIINYKKYKNSLAEEEKL
jgi:hypothetical protein